MGNFSSTLATPLLLTLILMGCGQPEVLDPPPEETGFFSPPPWNRWEQVDEDTRIPVGIHSSDEFDWALEDRPIYFHTFEDVERHRPRWEPFFNLWGDYLYWPDQELIAWQFSIMGDSSYDRNFAQMPDRWQIGRGRFIGFGEPFADEYLHMFECGVGSSAVHNYQVNYYRVKDYIIRCHGLYKLWVFLIADPDAPPPPRMAPDDPGRGAPDRLPDRWLTWVLDAREKYGLAGQSYPPEPDYSLMKHLDIYVFDSNEASLRTVRLIRPGAATDSGSGDYIWLFNIGLIPSEHCTDLGLTTSTCLPNNR